MPASAADRARAKLEERAIDVQAISSELAEPTAWLLRYDSAENNRHEQLLMRDGHDQIARALVVGDQAEVVRLRALHTKAIEMGRLGHALAGDVARFLELRDQPRLFVEEVATA